MPKALVQDGTRLRLEPSDVTAVEESPALKPSDTIAVGDPSAVAQVVPLFGVAPLRPYGSLGTRQEVETELDGMAAAIRSFSLKQPDQVMREVAAYSARLTELAVLLHRVESLDRTYTRVRTQQVERWQKELELQFKIASRLIEVMRQDLELMR